ncbi:glycerophosphodiester phosphodiesterase family protein [Enterococcus hermanniensis]|uniref:GP-PDE domain-containing protein n=1 Tax=Enterococcus hermanniensis TaxID=249189 RepID=A0A1L8TH46_9ENTE|nr:glycerophosphodiester phosphodiesterase family protein [Enterococcus hermanniensis]OJG43641.1 hypothetical protein RV04_GL000637 [Enterococcus hermanniensis]
MSTVRTRYFAFFHSPLLVVFAFFTFSLSFLNQGLYWFYQNAFKQGHFSWFYYLGLLVLISLYALTFNYLQTKRQMLHCSFSLKAFSLHLFVMIFLSPIFFWRFYQLFLAWRPLPAKFLSFVFLYRWKVLPVVVLIYLLLLYFIYRLILSAYFIETSCTLKEGFVLSWQKTKKSVGHQLVGFLFLPTIILLSQFLLKLLFIHGTSVLHDTALAVLFLTAYFILKNGLQLLFLFYLSSIGKSAPFKANTTFVHFGTIFSAVLCIGVYSFYSNHLFNQYNDTQALTISHRGVTADNALQNSLTALKKTHAKKQHDLIEMDIQETADNQLVVMHDENLKKLANKDVRIDETTWEELKHLTLKENGYQEDIPLFSDYLKTANAIHQKLLIELKVSAKTKSTIIKQLLPLRSQLAHHQFQSMDLETAEKIKQEFPTHQVGYILPFDLLGSPHNTVDFVAIESRTASSALIQALKYRQQNIYSWPVNSARAASAFRLYNLNGLISDDLTSLNTKSSTLSKKTASILLLN